MKKLKRKWKVYLIHHTHSDIGYTDTQKKVFQIQINHMNKALKLIKENLDKEFHQRFRWNPEVTWIFEKWLKTASEEDKKDLIKYIQEGYIGVDGLYANFLTGLMRPMEFQRNFDEKKTIEDLTGISVNSAMITDIPGWNWGIVKYFSDNNIKYLSAGTNRSDRVGYIIEEFGDKPFYWTSKSGKEKVLTWIHGKGYSWFHTGIHDKKNLSRKLTPSRINNYLYRLEEDGYPYDMVIIRYNIGQDNGPPDETLCEKVEKWNKVYKNMKLHISTTSESFQLFEDRYKEQIPTLVGDITPYWEDGAMSTSKATSISRNASERLELVEKISKNKGLKINEKKLKKAWKNIMFYSEHTWGAYNSITKPESTFAKRQWKWKKARALLGEKYSKELIGEIKNKFKDSIENKVVIINPHDFQIDKVVTVKTEYSNILNEKGEPVKVQKLNNGNLAFVVNIKANEKLTYTFTNEESIVNEQLEKNIKINFNKNNGTIKSIKYFGTELVNNTQYGFNEYLFVSGKWGSNLHNHNPKKISVKKIDDGPLIEKYLVVCEALQCKKISTRVTINHYNKLLTIDNVVDRKKYTKKEGLYFAFPFNFINGEIKYDTLDTYSIVEKTQLKGANKNFITATRWVDVSDENIGVTMYLKDAPIFKTEKIYHDPIRSGPGKLCGWRNSIKETNTVFSYIMNNYWQTNYKAYQCDKVKFTYVIKPHKGFEESKVNEFALSNAQNLLVIQ